VYAVAPQVRNVRPSGRTCGKTKPGRSGGELGPKQLPLAIHEGWVHEQPAVGRYLWGVEFLEAPVPWQHRVQAQGRGLDRRGPLVHEHEHHGGRRAQACKRPGQPSPQLPPGVGGAPAGHGGRDLRVDPSQLQGDVVRGLPTAAGLLLEAAANELVERCRSDGTSADSAGGSVSRILPTRLASPRASNARHPVLMNRSTGAIATSARYPRPEARSPRSGGVSHFPGSL
jgi:hypothetical protein